MSRFASRLLGLILIHGLLAGSACAGVVITGTRVVYPLEEKEVTVAVSNDGRRAALVQAWMDDGNANARPDDSKVPFFITPPVFRMEPQKSQTLRLFYTGTSLPGDRESIFWLNVLNISPNMATTNSVQFAFRTRIKVFVRPSGLPGKSAEAPARLSWKVVAAANGQGRVLSVSNPTPYYVSLSEFVVENGGQSYANKDGGMVAPQGVVQLPVAGMKAAVAGAKIHYKAIDDNGGELRGEAVLGL